MQDVVTYCEMCGLPDPEHNPYCFCGSPVWRTVRADILDELIALARICAEDLSIEIAERYQGRDKYPTLQRRYENDMAPVVQIYACIEKLENSGSRR